VFAEMGGEVKARVHVAMEQHEFTQDISLNGQGNVARRKIEEPVGSRGWGSSTASSTNWRLERSGTDGLRCTSGSPMYLSKESVFARCSQANRN
jgi:hypothetical protein